MTNPLNAGNKLHSEAVRKGTEDKLVQGALGMPDTSPISLSGDGPRSCMDSTTDWQLIGGWILQCRNSIILELQG